MEVKEKRNERMLENLLAQRTRRVHKRCVYDIYIYRKYNTPDTHGNSHENSKSFYAWWFECIRLALFSIVLSNVCAIRSVHMYIFPYTQVRVFVDADGWKLMPFVSIVSLYVLFIAANATAILLLVCVCVFFNSIRLLVRSFIRLFVRSFWFCFLFGWHFIFWCLRFSRYTKLRRFV